MKKPLNALEMYHSNSALASGGATSAEGGLECSSCLRKAVRFNLMMHPESPPAESMRKNHIAHQSVSLDSTLFAFPVEVGKVLASHSSLVTFCCFSGHLGW